MIAETLAAAAFAIVLVVGAVALAFIGRKSVGESWPELSELEGEVRKIQDGQVKLIASVEAIHARLPRRIDSRYDLQAKVGEGGIGEVWAATDSQLGVRVAVKLLQRRLSDDPEVRRRFIRESRVAKKLIHPNIVRTFDAGEDVSGQLYLVMELLDGRTLRHVLEEQPAGLPTIAEIARIGAGLARALVAAGGFGIVHRDIKPENVCYDTITSSVKLGDWGLGFVTSSDEYAARVTEEGRISGTPHYMSPEQARGSVELDASTDIYSLGCVLYELATGRPPFRAATVDALLLAHCSRATPPIPDYPLLSELVGRMTAKTPSARPDARAVLETLEAIQPLALVRTLG